MVVDLNTKILVVDDYPTMVHIIRNQLRQLNFRNVDDALDGESALRKLLDGKFGLVISDWNMKPMNGLELLKAIRADHKFKDLPFIMVTAEEDTEKSFSFDAYVSCSSTGASRISRSPQQSRWPVEGRA